MSNFKRNFGIFSIIFFIGISYPLAVASLNPEFWTIETTWIFRSAIYATFLSFIGFILSGSVTSSSVAYPCYFSSGFQRNKTCEGGE